MGYIIFIFSTLILTFWLYILIWVFCCMHYLIFELNLNYSCLDFCHSKLFHLILLFLLGTTNNPFNHYHPSIQICLSYSFLQCFMFCTTRTAHTLSLCDLFRSCLPLYIPLYINGSLIIKHHKASIQIQKSNKFTLCLLL